MLKTATQIAEELNKPATTIRAWGQRFRKYLPVTTEGRYHKYLPEATKIFQRINNLLSDHSTTYTEVEKMLVKEFGEFHLEEGEVETTKPATEERQLVPAGFFDIVVRQQAQLDKIGEAVELLAQILATQQQQATPKPRRTYKKRATTRKKVKPKKPKNRLVAFLTKKVL